MGRKRKKKQRKHTQPAIAQSLGSPPSQAIVNVQGESKQIAPSILIAQILCRALLAKEQLRCQENVIKSVILMQQLWKDYMEKRQASAVVLQNARRCHLARKQLGGLREEADRAKKELVSKISQRMKKLVEIEKRREAFSMVVKKGLYSLTEADEIERKWFYSEEADMFPLKEEIKRLREELHRIDPTDGEWDDLMHEAVPPKPHSSAFWQSCSSLKDLAAQAVTAVGVVAGIYER